MQWIDKYKPRHINDLILSDEMNSKMARFINFEQSDNLIVSGDTGFGKSILLHCLGNDMYGKLTSQYVCHLNALYVRNVDSLKLTIERFSRKVIIGKFNKRLVIIDDIDNSTDKIQNIISWMMEKYSNILFAFTCTDNSNINNTIQSRCLTLKLSKPTDNELVHYLQNICTKENVTVDEESLKYICHVSQCDIRTSINTLQLIHQSYKCITIENINALCDIPNVVQLRNIIEMCINNDKQKDIIQKLLNLTNMGYTCGDILMAFFDTLRDENYKIDEHIKICMLNEICRCMYEISKKIDSKLQLIDCFLQISRVIHQKTI